MSELILPSVAQIPETIRRNVPSLDNFIEARDEVYDAAVVLWRKINPAPPQNEPLEWHDGHLWIGLT